MNNAYDCTTEEIKQALFSGDFVESGYGVDYTFKDVIEECRDLEDILQDIATCEDSDKQPHAHNIKVELSIAADRVAIEIQESFRE